MTKDKDEAPRYVEPNSGAAPQPGGFAGGAPVAQESTKGDGAAPSDAETANPEPKQPAEGESKATSKARKA